MHSVTITITRLFDVHRVRASRTSTQHTLFGFESLGLKKPYVRVPGWPRLEVGDTLVVLIAKNGDWQSLRGWKNRTTDEKVGPSVYEAVRRFCFAIMFTLPFIYFLADDDPGHPIWSPFWAVLGIFMIAMALSELVQAVRVRRWLETAT